MTPAGALLGPFVGRLACAARLGAVLGAVALGACAPSAAAVRPISLAFRGEVGGEPFVCGAAYDGVGTSGTTFTARDFRFYVHDVRVVTSDGVEVPVALDDDGVWQDGDVALLDFEAGVGCDGGNAPTNVLVRGTIPAATGAVTGVRFVVGVPEGRNHLDAATQPSPLNVTSMFWGWMDGYKYALVAGETTGQPLGMLFQLGATGCAGDARMGTRICANGNRPEIAIDGVSEDALESGVIVADAAAIFATTNLDVDGGDAAGCMSLESDPECETMFAQIGLRGDAQRVFHFEPAP